MSKKLKGIVMVLFILFPMFLCTDNSRASTGILLLNCYNREMKIGDEFRLICVLSTGEQPKFSSSKSAVASVNAYGKVQAKKAGETEIRVKVKGKTATCRVVVNPTTITLNVEQFTMERGEEKLLRAVTSNGSSVSWKSNKTSVVKVDNKGKITAVKPGEAIVTATADKTKKTCRIKVKKPEVYLDKSAVKLYCTRRTRLTAKVSSGMKPVWKSSSTKVAIVSETGMITALKPGECKITATVDGVKKTCKVTVVKPKITLNVKALQLKEGESYTLKASCNYTDALEWYTSNDTIISVNEKGRIKALRKGSTYVYASLYGVKVKCHVKVKE